MAVAVKEKRKTSPTKRAPNGDFITKYNPDYCDIARKMSQLGATEFEIAEALGVNRLTINRWEITYPEFSEAMKLGKEAADNKVEKSLYQRARGYEYDAVKVFLHKETQQPIYAPYKEHVPPDPVACIFWLTNRRHDRWRHRRELEVSGPNKGPIKVVSVKMTLQEMASLYARTVADPDALPDAVEGEVEDIPQITFKTGEKVG